MDKQNTRKVERVTEAPKNHLFGFHDLLATNKNGDKLLSLEVEVINRPPLPGEKIGVGYIDLKTHQFIELGKTNAFNYPQGARQQWIDDTHFIVNNQTGDHWGADIYDVVSATKVKSIDSTCHCLSLDKRKAFGINYSRLFRLGGYGYIGIHDKTEGTEMPDDDGIFMTDIATNKTTLLVSIYDVAQCQPQTSLRNGSHHYITHLVLSPDGKRIAFLHRCFLADGGIRTRLMTIGVDGTGLRCLASGFLSHFDWRDNNRLFIWGRAGSSIDAARSNPLLSNKFVRPLLKMAKAIFRLVLKNSKQLSMSFLMITDTPSSTITRFAEGIVTSDGHPMCNPTNRDICICDTYPNENKERTLFIYRFSTNERIDIGKFRMIDDKPDMTLLSEFTKGLDKRVLEMITPQLFSFTRSGLHCDLHPRWSADGRYAIFDSIHEGTRQIYMYKI